MYIVQRTLELIPSPALPLSPFPSWPGQFGYRTRINYYSSSSLSWTSGDGTVYQLGNSDNDNSRILREHRFSQAAKGDESGTCGESGRSRTT